MKLKLAMLACAAALWAKDSCLECHSELDGSLAAPTQAFKDDVHKGLGFSCVHCHGGDSSTDDPERSMSRARGFRGKIARTAVPELCAHCHSDAALIHKYNPKQRVDQMAQYKTSVHGQRLAKGDVNVANCVDCHSVHNIRAVRSPLSPVHPLRLPDTCSTCHSDANRMAKYGIPSNQHAEYRSSVHWEALEKRGDLSAPSCASCHGNHGATPPEVTSVAAVCGTCHVLMENLYKESPHEPVFAAMEKGGCVVCHGNHAVEHPTTDLLVGKSSVCADCHEADSAGGKVAEEMGRSILELRAALDRSDEILGRARRSGMEVSEPLLRQMEGRENLVKARVAVHAFDAAAVRQPVQDGLAIAAETHNAGEEAMRERDYRRMGLGLSLIAIAATMIGLWLAIRSIEGREKPIASPDGGG
ncbi:MAG: cytochrome c3 family protein [Bryobacteraceae bacterium]|nr:cytochrome c3 family protein [Bryobacteraceae bacterium]